MLLLLLLLNNHMLLLLLLLDENLRGLLLLLEHGLWSIDLMNSVHNNVLLIDGLLKYLCGSSYTMCDRRRMHHPLLLHNTTIGSHSVHTFVGSLWILLLLGRLLDRSSS